jgi:hypothetical protein
VSGVLDRLKSSWPPRVATDSGSPVLVKGCPFSCTPVTYGVLSPAAGALMLIAPPLPRWTTACWNSGLPSARSARPGVTGNTPSADHTYQDDIAPRSSLPGSPFGVGG